MKKLFAALFFVLLASTGFTMAQEPCCNCAADCDCGPHFWARAEYLLWWIKDAPMPVPVVATGPIVDNLQPVLGQPGTSVLIGGESIGNSTRSGGRFTRCRPS